jgi:hypothetical protein
MFESPMLQKILAENTHKSIKEVLKARFGSVPTEVVRLLGDILDDRKLTKLLRVAAKCPNMDKFRDTLLA